MFSERKTQKESIFILFSLRLEIRTKLWLEEFCNRNEIVGTGEN